MKHLQIAQSLLLSVALVVMELPVIADETDTDIQSYELEGYRLRHKDEVLEVGLRSCPVCTTRWYPLADSAEIKYRSRTLSADALSRYRRYSVYVEVETSQEAIVKFYISR